MYRFPEQAKELISNMLNKMQEKDIIESSTASWLSSILLVNKPYGGKRMCLDYRKVSKELTTNIHPLPKLEEIVEAIAGDEYYATLDL